MANREATVTDYEEMMKLFRSRGVTPLVLIFVLPATAVWTVGIALVPGMIISSIILAAMQWNVFILTRDVRDRLY